jgi:hypothetical protein
MQTYTNNRRIMMKDSKTSVILSISLMAWACQPSGRRNTILTGCELGIINKTCKDIPKSQNERIRLHRKISVLPSVRGCHRHQPTTRFTLDRRQEMVSRLLCTSLLSLC